MKGILAFFLIVTVIFGVVGASKIASGFYFDFGKVLSHFTEDFPVWEYNTSGWTPADWALYTCMYGSSLVKWFFSFDPWTYGTPSYRGEIPWKAVV